MDHASEASSDNPFFDTSEYRQVIEETVDEEFTLELHREPYRVESVLVDETAPLLQTSKRSERNILLDGIKGTPGALLALLLNLLDAMSYGIIIFPASDPHMPSTASQAGISMFLASSLISQIVFSFGGSGFSGAVGSMMIEVIPFLHLMVEQIEHTMQGASDAAIMSTVMTAYAMSTVLTGITFLLLGIFKLGTIIQFFPRHVLVGCIGGIGLFLIFTAIEVTAGIEPVINLHFFESLIAPRALVLWGSSLLAALVLKLIQSINHNPLVVPAFYCILPIGFYAIVLSLGIPFEDLRSMGWMFKLPDAADAPFYTPWTYIDLGQINWYAVLVTLPTQLALTFFGILHVPINVPALSVSTKQDVDLSWEIIGHGIGNLASGVLFLPQNYMVYSNSLLFLRSGGGSFASEVVLCITSVFLWIEGAFVAGFVPVIVVGALIFHLGVDLLKESVYDSWKAGIHPLEYLTILVIVFVMGFIGFTEGIIVGLLLTSLFFVAIYANKSVIKESFKGSDLRSTVHRLYRQQMFLDKVGSQIHIIKLQGFMFFGTINQLSASVDETLLKFPETRFLVFDFSLVNGIDYSGFESFSRIKRILFMKRIHVIFCGLGTVMEDFKRSGLLQVEEQYEDEIKMFEDLNNALEWCENKLLSIYYQRSQPQIVHTQPKQVIGTPTPRERQIHAAASLIHHEHPHVEPSKELTGPVALLIPAFGDFSGMDYDMLALFGPQFECLTVEEGDVIYKMEDEADALYIVEQGQLGLKLSPERGSKIVETLLPGTMVGSLEMFGNRPRACYLVSLTESVVWRLSKETFENIGKTHPELTLSFVTRIAVPFDTVRYYNSVHHWAQL
ncbi:sulfate transporter family-domain-containing protein [Gorgonomyces haynaldii]|nr:sulfate transporter family-domain-containing protein [Gorgonomyces haynaldii]